MIDLYRKIYDIKTAKNFNKIRVGSRYDGGYVTLDDFDGIKLAISGGVGKDDNWETQVAERCKVIAYDPMNLNNDNKRYHFVNEKFPTLDELVMSQADNSVIAKIDIEGDEFNIINRSSIESLKKIRQLVLEVHLSNFDLSADQITALEKIMSVFQTIHIHGNNNSQKTLKIDNFVVTEIFELTLVNKDYYTFEPFDGILPSELDSPCNGVFPEIKIWF